MFFCSLQYTFGSGEASENEQLTDNNIGADTLMQQRCTDNKMRGLQLDVSGVTEGSPISKVGPSILSIWPALKWALNFRTDLNNFVKSLF